MFLATAAPRYRIALAGAGPAGLAAALALARDGHEVHVYERHPGLAPVGAGLLIQPQGLEALESLGLREAFDAVSVPVDRLLGHSHRGWTLVDLDMARRPARGVSRAQLAGLLGHAAAEAGARLHFGEPVESLRAEGAGAWVNHGGAASRFDLCVIANGAASSLRTPAGLADAARPYAWGALWGQFTVPGWDGATTLLQRYHGTREMVGLLPTEMTPQGLRLSLFWSLRRDGYAAWRASDLGAWRRRLLDLWPEARPVFDQVQRHDDLALAVYRHSWPRRMARGPFAVMGDAAHAMSPQLGLGTTLALQDALALAHGLRSHGTLAAGLAAYSRDRLWPSRAYQTLSRLLTPCFQSTHGGWVRDAAFAFGRKVPGVQWAMQRSLTEPPPGTRTP
ncbi:NAD(P)/FAD-dependent oxidoreductase [Xylophilus sp. Leaf220]|uniref:FAD-dependent oxidoreductase n=1 Tax=Xylophilus sp. Leaf220 TaxID=1735686 RepID=UPI0006F929B8|nr:NAD(P)/FAD-dependent oxidoreductase [Xylophilus sp. Leaf220]KQM78734.1 FAD-binding monooxygenase [Xylophilus sp. Leaf220]